MIDERLAAVLEKDPRYKLEAYLFLLAALDFTRRMTKKEKHVTGQELLEGIKQLAIKNFGMMSKTVFESWGVKTTDDFGEIVFNLVDAKLLSKTEEDKKKDFHQVYDFEDVFVKRYNFSKKDE